MIRGRTFFPSLRRWMVLGALLGLPSVFAFAAPPNFTRINGVKLSSAVPQAVDISTSPFRLYFLRNDYQILSATSTDGLTWGEESGIRLSTGTLPAVTTAVITGCSLLPLDDGGYRMAYSVDAVGGVWKIFTATSSDGLSWANETPELLSSTNVFVGSPRLVELNNGSWRLYYVVDSNGGNDQTDRRVFSAVSTDEGLTFSTPVNIFNTQTSDIGVMKRTDGRIRLVFTQPLSGSTTNSLLLSALSSTALGDTFTAENSVRLSTDTAIGGFSGPTLFRSTDTVRWRLLYGFTLNNSTTTHVYSAFTATPSVQSISPDARNRTDPPVEITIFGEIFDSTPTVSLTRSGESDIVGTGVTRVSDQEFSATFNITNQALGTWTVEVTNPDGITGTAPNVFSISFQTGEVSVLNPLIRPGTGDPAQITVEVFVEDTLRVQIYTLEGRLVNTLYDGVAGTGPHVFTWDGVTGQGRSVASGTYLLRVEGAKIDLIKNLVVIR